MHQEIPEERESADDDLEVGSFTIDTRVTTKSQDFFSTSQNSSVICHQSKLFCTWLLCQSTRDVLCSSLWISFPTRIEVSRWHIPDCGSHIQGGILECFCFGGGLRGPIFLEGMGMLKLISTKEIRPGLTRQIFDSRFSIFDSRSRFSIFDSRFSILDSRFSILDFRFSSLDSRVSILDSRVSSLDSRFSILESRVSILDFRFSILESRVDFRFSILESRVSSLDSRVSILDAPFSILDSRVSILDFRFSILDSRFSSLDSRFSILHSRFSSLASRFSILDARFSSLVSSFLEWTASVHTSHMSKPVM